MTNSHLRMPFRLRNTVQTLQRFMDSMTSDLNFVHVYNDDPIIASSNVDKHSQHQTPLFHRISDNGITVNPDNCELGKQEIKFLDYSVKQEGSLSCEDEVRVIMEYHMASYSHANM